MEYVPRLPWYSRLERLVAPTEPASNFALLIIMAICLLVLARGSATAKAALVVYLVSP